MKNYKHIFLLVITMVFANLFLTGCFDNNSKPKDMKKVRLAIGMQPTSALSIIALEKGYFKDNGLDAQISTHPSGKRALKDALLKGEADIAIAADVPTVIALLEKKPISVVATSASADNNNRVIARKSVGIQSPFGLKGKKIATQKGSAVHFFLDLFMMKNGINYDDVEISFMKAEKLPPALASKSIDAFSMREPYISQAKELLDGDSVIFAEPGLYRQVEAISVNNNFLAKNPDSVNRFLKSLAMAEDFSKKSPQKAIEIVAKKLGAPKKSIEKLWTQIDCNLAIESSTVTTFQNIAQWAINHKMVDINKVPKIINNFHIENLKQVKPESVKLAQ